MAEERGYMTEERGYMAAERGYITEERSYITEERGYIEPVLIEATMFATQPVCNAARAAQALCSDRYISNYAIKY